MPDCSLANTCPGALFCLSLRYRWPLFSFALSVLRLICVSFSPPLCIVCPCAFMFSSSIFSHPASLRSHKHILLLFLKSLFITILLKSVFCFCQCAFVKAWFLKDRRGFRYGRECVRQMLVVVDPEAEGIWRSATFTTPTCHRDTHLRCMDLNKLLNATEAHR